MNSREKVEKVFKLWPRKCSNCGGLILCINVWRCKINDKNRYVCTTCAPTLSKAEKYYYPKPDMTPQELAVAGILPAHWPDPEIAAIDDEEVENLDDFGAMPHNFYCSDESEDIEDESLVVLHDLDVVENESPVEQVVSPASACDGCPGGRCGPTTPTPEYDTPRANSVDSPEPVRESCSTPMADSGSDWSNDD